MPSFSELMNQKDNKTKLQTTKIYDCMEPIPVKIAHQEKSLTAQSISTASSSNGSNLNGGVGLTYHSPKANTITSNYDTEQDPKSDFIKKFFHQMKAKAGLTENAAMPKYGEGAFGKSNYQNFKNYLEAKQKLLKFQNDEYSNTESDSEDHEVMIENKLVGFKKASNLLSKKLSKNIIKNSM